MQKQSTQMQKKPTQSILGKENEGIRMKGLKGKELKFDKFTNESVITCYRKIAHHKKKREQSKPNYRRGHTSFLQSIDPMTASASASASVLEETPYLEFEGDAIAYEEDARYDEFEYPRI
jgi:hypothetical protein